MVNIFLYCQFLGQKSGNVSWVIWIRLYQKTVVHFTILPGPGTQNLSENVSWVNGSRLCDHDQPRLEFYILGAHKLK